ncbi:gastrula zinc finger protein xFG20-1 isoform X1 [Plutella xylostella]|uniref:gastrula zinc finger protein xFG20-1 isoform X1 n=2 Tax=Plutella xylostella TaxID=51655 RepID=UPI002032F482|nr:gastrula zinc finger protein xFG20-1 isoform X1 [Plutella xylostella]
MEEGKNLKGKLTCAYCDKEFKFASERKRHEISHCIEFECKVCLKKFNFLSALRRHEKQHERTGNVQCAECGGSFRDQTLLNRHIKYAHKETVMCEKCHSMFNSEAALNTHMKCHKPKEERKYKCSFTDCDKTFNFPHHLKHHELTHTNTKQYHCSICSKGFIQAHHLKRHLKTHKPESWVSCSLCPKTFSSLYSLKRHIARHNIKCENTQMETDCKNGELTKKGDKLSMCACCGELIDESEIGAHALVCGQTEIENHVMSSSPSPIKLTKEDVCNELSIMETESKYDKESKHQDNPKDNDTNDNDFIDDLTTNMNEISVSSCKTAIGECIVAGDSTNNGLCLCAQITDTVETDKPELSVTEADSTKISIDVLNSPIETCGNVNDNNCISCACSVSEYKKESVADTTPKKKSAIHYDSVPEIEVRLDGVIKLKDTCDIKYIGLPHVMSHVSKIFNQMDKNTTEVKVPFNSCKAVLGNCIVSGNDTIGEGCYCARMSFDSQQASAQEIEEITICSGHHWIS